jgi:hypothetical protein
VRHAEQQQEEGYDEMADAVVKCHACGSDRLKRLREMNPDTTAPTMNVLMKCLDCGDEWIYQVASRHAQKSNGGGLVM